MPNSILKVENLKKSFQIAGGLFQKKQYVNAVIDVSFEIEEGTTFSLVGESGCGKSTTGRLITRLIAPTNGSIIVDGKEVATAKQSELKHLRQNSNDFSRPICLFESKNEGQGAYWGAFRNSYKTFKSRA